MATKSNERDVVLTDSRQRDQARQVVDSFTSDPTQFTAATPDGESIAVPPELSGIIRHLLRVVADGGAITVSAMPEELTTTVAARELGISRPTLMKKIKAGEIPAHKVGTHTRLRTADVLAMRDARLARRRAAFEELRALDDED
ncbi:helix-turn-helix domain-containing protein [Saccharomonospora sp. NB11]|jgi:excisionase family DNA binding protein|uniref:helix-turn-helix domain-containing protein n=1 Tax=Saccharomonospora sp. NB11 TaxID=1642298 RepID=UPI0018D0196F|nr:helix-turn-helix domain-containing protein [Saccharomonospora sp. NB11]